MSCFLEGRVAVYTVFMVFPLAPKNLLKALAKHLVKNLLKNLPKNLAKNSYYKFTKNCPKNKLGTPQTLLEAPPKKT